MFREQGIEPVILGDSITGEAREVGKARWRELRAAHESAGGADLRRRMHGDDRSGEGGRGGRCGEFLLALGIETDGGRCWAIAADTDGIDGSEDNAGALLTPDSMRAGALDAKAFLAGTTATGSSSGSATWWSPGRRAPTSTTTARSWSPS